MSCAHLRGLDTLVLGTPGFIDYRVFPLSTYATYRCQNTSNGPTISLKCDSCQIPRRNYLISWRFVDLPNDPAMAVGFQFKLTVKDHGNDKYVSFVSGTLQSDSYADDNPRTFRGPDPNILRIHLFPQIYNNKHGLKLIQPLVHDFIPGSSFTNVSDLQASLQRPTNGLVNTTLDISYLSDYIVEINKENVMGPVGFLANAGGLYAVSFAIFLYFLLQCEARIKKLRNEDSVMRDIRRHRRAQHHWDKLRKYVSYTWGCSSMDVKDINGKQRGGCLGGMGMPKMKLSSRLDSLRLDMNAPEETSFSGKASSKASDNAGTTCGEFPGPEVAVVKGQNEIQLCK
ncbi:uncharacterized protein LOC109823712 [Asparagus officinalis]|uniref:uncharacterized protein LOC109823712 n=1 Tax=Asparagus officinalis TaxID=4686 RepID=UPI00098DF034|nr:uncharacterized protein LOC109823712 [Asparagus officinalis]